jgi:hypothetical protein
VLNPPIDSTIVCKENVRIVGFEFIGVNKQIKLIKLDVRLIDVTNKTKPRSEDRGERKNDFVRRKRLYRMIGSLALRSL